MSATSDCACSLMRVKFARSSCSVVPGGGAFMRSCSRKPATRISKNSSRLLLTMHRNRSRSSSGTPGSSASASTRRLNASSDSSRLIGGASRLLGDSSGMMGGVDAAGCARGGAAASV